VQDVSPAVSSPGEHERELHTGQTGGECAPHAKNKESSDRLFLDVARMRPAREEQGTRGRNGMKKGRGRFRKLRDRIAGKVSARAKAGLLWVAKALFVWAALTVLTVLALRWVPPPTSSFMLRQHVRNLLPGKKSIPVRYHWVGWNKISPYAAVAVMASEDQKFPFHRGFDFDSIQKALNENPKRARPRGASTISQQVAKNLFLWPGRSLTRKGLEAGFTVLIEALWPKRRIMEVYLNIAEFGPGVYGVAGASEAFFGKEPRRLTPDEAARLAAVLPNPKRLRADRPSAYVERRTREILGQMRGLGWTSALRGL
jgi:monofunctional glycosyltransferase